MKRICCLLVALFLLTTAIFTQSQKPKVFEVTTDTLYFQDLDTANWRILPDKGEKYSIDEVMAMQVAGGFKPLSQLSEKNSRVYWVQYQLHNTLTRPARIALNAMNDFDAFYVKTGEEPIRYFRSGRFTDYKLKDGLKIADCIPLNMEPGATYTVYQRVEHKKAGLPENFLINIVSTDIVLKNYYLNKVDNQHNYYNSTQLQEAFIIGMIFLAVFMNLFFYRIVHEKLYLYFALAAFFLAINRMYNISSAYLFYKNPFLLDNVKYLSLAWMFITFFFVQFYRSFLNLKQRFPKLDRIFIGTAWLFIALSLASFLAPKFNLGANNWIYVLPGRMVFQLIPALQILVQVVCLKNAPKANYYLLAGSSPLLVLLASSMFYSQEGFQYFKDSPLRRWMAENYRLAEAICIALLLLSITWVLFLRFIELRKQNAQQALDKERLLREKEVERNELIAAQKIQLEKEVEERTSELQYSLKELRTAQAQLVQSEKMAALGELTAGIAHEIQNPLNFVNNFSEVSVELVDEMKQEFDNGRTAEAAAIAEDIQQNLEKIAHHGKRAESIVKGMLQHSRSSSGQKEPTDINALCDEYLRLSYHGLRAKDKSFSASYTTAFDDSMGPVQIVPQDISRVMLNLYNNAFFAVNEKKKSAPQDYVPAVHVSTRKDGSGVLISVKDHGNGISPNLLQKIFQPFFTTKPTGEGTGLGLSLSYDIVKAHNGTIRVESTEGEGTTFFVHLPIV